MQTESFQIINNKVIIHIHARICETPEDIVKSPLFAEIITRAVKKLEKRHSILLQVFPKKSVSKNNIKNLIKTIELLAKMEASLVLSVVPEAKIHLKDPALLNEFIEYVYNFWRSFDRFLISDSKGRHLDKHPYTTFNTTIGQLTNLVRGMYRDIQENITGRHPRIYRQVAAGAEVSSIAVNATFPLEKEPYSQLSKIPVIRQILIYPPLILNPPINKRSGTFEPVDVNPLSLFEMNSRDWLCYPAKVGTLTIWMYFHNRFSELGHSLCNLFQLAEDEDLKQKPDAIMAFGVPQKVLSKFGNWPTVFYDDEKNGVLVGAIPDSDDFGYFGYLKKMSLTLHNVIMMKRGRMPFHGALLRLILKGNVSRTLLFIGDTGAGKSETLEALRSLGEEEIQDLIIIADDMGSLEINAKKQIIGYGTEIGAFLRLDDLKPGYALGQIDRAIIMSPNQTNARIILPVATHEIVTMGHKVDFVFYANNYEEIDRDHPLIERFSSPEKALDVFREGTVMSKGTTTSTGIVHSYFANVFGPVQFKDLHEPLAKKFFSAFFKQKIFVGQIRTRLGLKGWEQDGPQEASKELLKLILSEKKS